MPVVNIGELHIIQHNVRHYWNNIDKLHADWTNENPDIILFIGDLNLKHKALGMGMVKPNEEGKDFYNICLSSSDINYINP